MDRLDEAVDCLQLSQEADRLCTACALRGKRRRIIALQLNFSEAVYLCSEPECYFPLDVKNLDCVVVKRKPNVQEVGDLPKCKKRKIYSSDKVSSNISATCRVSSESANTNLVSEGNSSCTSIDQPSERYEKISVQAAQNSEISLRKVSVPNRLSRFETFESFVRAVNVSSVCSTPTSNISSQSSVCSMPTSNISSQSQTNSCVSKFSLVSCSQSIVTASNALSNSLSVDKTNLSVELSHSTVVPMSLVQDSVCSTASSKLTSTDFERDKLPLEFATNQQVVNHQTVQQPEVSRDHLQMTNASNIQDIRLETPVPSVADDQKTVVGVLSNEVSCKEKVDIPLALTDRLFLHWANSEAMCWLDVAMAVIIHCNFIRKTIAVDSDASCKSTIRRMVTDYDRAQADFRRSSKLNRCHYLCGQGKVVKLETSVGHITVKTGGGDMGARLMPEAALSFQSGSVATIDVDDISGIVSDSDPGTTSVERVSREARRLHDQAKRILIDVREYAFEVMQRKLLSQRGQNDSALLALSTLLAEDSFITEQLLVKYSFRLTCTRCKHVETNRVSKDVPTFMKLPDNFTMTSPSFLRRCFNCSEPDQVLEIIFEKLPDSFYCHFAHGVVHSDIKKYDFISNGRQFYVTGVVQYITKPSHFICHFRQLDVSDDLWMTYDDLKPSAACRFKRQVLTLPPSEVHIVLWESRPATSASRPIEHCTPTRSSVVLVQASVSSCSNVVPAALLSQPCTQTVASSLCNMIPPVPVRSLSPAPSQISVQSQSNLKEIVDSSRSIDDRLQRAREKFLRDQNGVRGSAIGAVVPPKSCSVSSVVAAARTKTRYGVSMPPRTAAMRSERIVSLRQKLHLSTTAPAEVYKPQVPIVSATRARTVVCSSLYDSVLPLIHKKSDTSYTRQSSVFSGYVPKGKQVVPLEQSMAQNVSCAQTNLNVQQQAHDDVRRPKVCFNLPVTIDSSVQQHNIPSAFNSKGIILSDQLTTCTGSALFDGTKLTSTTSNSLASVPVISSGSTLISTKCSGGPVQINEYNTGSSVLSTTVPTATNEVHRVLSSAEIDASSEGIDDWLCDEILASDSFRTNGSYPENVMDETQFIFQNNSVAALVSSIISPTVDSSKCDILNGTSGSKSDSILPEPISQFTFDDMLSYLYN